MTTVKFVFDTGAQEKLEVNLNVWCLTPLSAIFQLDIMATSFSGGESQSNRR